MEGLHPGLCPQNGVSGYSIILSSSRTCKKCKCSGPNPDLTQELWGWDLTICILTSPLGVVNSHACSASRTIDLEAFLKCPSLGVHELGWGEKRVSFLFPLTSNQNTAFLSIWNGATNQNGVSQYASPVGTRDVVISHSWGCRYLKISLTLIATLKWC